MTEGIKSLIAKEKYLLCFKNLQNKNMGSIKKVDTMYNVKEKELD
jgi:hypothetical protein